MFLNHSEAGTTHKNFLGEVRSFLRIFMDAALDSDRIVADKVTGVMTARAPRMFPLQLPHNHRGVNIKQS